MGKALEMTYDEWLRTSYVPVMGGEAQQAAPETPPAPAPAPDTGGEEAGGDEGEQTPDIAAVMGRLGEMSQEFTGRMDQWEQRASQDGLRQEAIELGADPAGFGLDPQDDGLVPAFDSGQQQQQGYDGTGQQPGEQPGYGQQADAPLDPGDPQYVQNLIQGAVQDAVQQTVQPWMEQQERQQLREETEGLLEDYPELQDTEAARQTLSSARQWAEDIGAPELAGRPALLELVHLAAKAADQAQQETPAGADQGQVELEQPSGANPGSTASTQEDEAQRIVDAGSKHPFWGV